MSASQQSAACAIVLSPGERLRLEALSASLSAPRRVATRARIVLLAADGRSKRAIARELRVSTHTAVLWRRRYLAGGVENLLRDAPGRGRTATVTVGETAARLLRLAATPPARGRWTVRRLAEAAGVSRASTHRILRAALDPTFRPREVTSERRRNRWATTSL
jgi:transposase